MAPEPLTLEGASAPRAVGAGVRSVPSASSTTGVKHAADLIWTLVRTDFKVRYHGTVGGFLWALLKPFSMFLVLTTVFSLVFVADRHFVIKLLLGLFLWEFFAEGTKTGLLSLWAKGYLLTKSRFPRWIIVAASSANAVITFLVFVSVFLIYLAVVGRLPGPSRLLWFALYAIEMWLVIIGFALAMSVLYPRYRDLNHLWDAVSQAGFFIAPIVYPFEIVPQHVRVYMYLWPPTPIIQFARQVLIEGTTPSIAANLLLLGQTSAIVVIGIAVFAWLIPRTVEHL